MNTLSLHYYSKIMVRQRIRRPPAWFIVVIVISLLPTLLWPYLLANAKSAANENVTLLMLFPIYDLLSAFLAYRCFFDRNFLSWILIGLMWLSFGAVVLL